MDGLVGPETAGSDNWGSWQTNFCKSGFVFLILKLFYKPIPSNNVMNHSPGVVYVLFTKQQEKYIPEDLWQDIREPFKYYLADFFR